MMLTHAFQGFPSSPLADIHGMAMSGFEANERSTAETCPLALSV